MLLPLLLPLAPVQAHVAAYSRTIACVLELNGNLNTRRKGGRGPETVSETFHIVLHGWLEETESPSGTVVFAFTAAPDARVPPTGMLNQRREVHGKPLEWTQFYGSAVKASGPLRFSAGLRGQNLYPLGQMEVEGHASVHDAKGARDERTTVRLVPFPEVRKGPGDFAAPTLRFGTSSLWRLHKTEAPFMVKGSVTYRNGLGDASYAGRVELTFRLDPRIRK